jgi:hypothetical protein
MSELSSKSIPCIPNVLLASIPGMHPHVFEVAATLSHHCLLQVMELPSLMGMRVTCQVPESREGIYGHSTGVITGKKIKCDDCCMELQQQKQEGGQASRGARAEQAGKAAAAGNAVQVTMEPGKKGGTMGSAPQGSSGSGQPLKAVARSADGCYSRTNFAFHAKNKAKRPAAAITLVDFPELTLHVSIQGDSGDCTPKLWLRKRIF